MAATSMEEGRMGCVCYSEAERMENGVRKDQDTEKKEKKP